MTIQILLPCGMYVDLEYMSIREVCPSGRYVHPGCMSIWGVYPTWVCVHPGCMSICDVCLSCITGLWSKSVFTAFDLRMSSRSEQSMGCRQTSRELFAHKYVNISRCGYRRGSKGLTKLPLHKFIITIRLLLLLL